jgi:1-acyl-sn-glycerol-3-phosphate acyltransferase
MSVNSNSRLADRNHRGQTRYDHTKFEIRRRFLRLLLKGIAFTILIRLVKVEGLDHLPKRGPAILLINHIAFVDPIVIIHVVPRNIVPLAKIEVYDYPIIGIFPRLWGVIPVRREEVDRRAIQNALGVLRAGEIVLVAPEGTRGTELQQGKEGIAYLASRSGAPIVPVMLEGTPDFPTLPITEKWRKGGVKVKFGQPFRYRSDLKKANRDQLRLMTDEAMYVLASILPEQRRGVYADLSRATQETIQWL